MAVCSLSDTPRPSRCILSRYDETAEALCGRTCLEDYTHVCLAQILSSISPSSKSDDRICSTLVTWGGAEQLSTLPAVWLGDVATSGEWTTESRVGGLSNFMSGVASDWRNVPSSSLSSQPCAVFQSGAATLERVDDLRRANGSCSPSIFIPGVQKAATTYLFNVLANHPQVLRPLQGPGYKEAGAL